MGSSGTVLALTTAPDYGADLVRHESIALITEVEFEVWRDCAPCNLMDLSFGEGAQLAMKQRAGISASVIRGGTINTGDSFTLG